MHVSRQAYNISMDKIILMLHPVTGALAMIATLWLFVEALNASGRNRARLWWSSVIGAVLMAVTAVVSGYWYITYYAADKALILKGPWPIAHNLVMETKEHLFFVTLVLSLLLPIIISHEDIAANRGARILVLVTAGLVVLTAFALEGGGAFISMAVRMSIIK
jgi:hypothetical protein